ncbi:hypothetical protein LUZ60_007457 [Juncus effusus]|nr:hypothetical protein LUZ60_007457 [Juncus effusus]
MLGDLLTVTLTLLFGYAYPAFECFKMVETRPGQTEQLRFWCQYWTIVAMVLVFETLLSWLPMYAQAKLAFFVYLWYPKTKGSDLVYDTFLRPFVMQYEPNIEQRLKHLREKSGQILVFYVKNFTDKSATFFLDVLHQVVHQTPPNSRSHEEKIKGPIFKDEIVTNMSVNCVKNNRAKNKRPHYLTNLKR